MNSVASVRAFLLSGWRPDFTGVSGVFQDGVAPENVLDSRPCKIAESHDFPVGRGKTETHIGDNYISAQSPRPHFTGILISPDQFRKAVSKKISRPGQVPIHARDSDEFAGEVEWTDAEPRSDLASYYISPEEIGESIMIEICHPGDRPLIAR